MLEKPVNGMLTTREERLVRARWNNTKAGSVKKDNLQNKSCHLELGFHYPTARNGPLIHSGWRMKIHKHLQTFCSITIFSLCDFL